MRQTITLSIKPNIAIIKKIRSNVNKVCHKRVEN